MDLHEHLKRARAMKKLQTAEQKSAHGKMMIAKRWEKYHQEMKQKNPDNNPTSAPRINPE